MLATTTTSERTGHWTKMRRSLAPFTAPELLVHTRSLADFITTTSGFRFSVHTAEFGQKFDLCQNGRKSLYNKYLAWLCWQSEANPSLPAKLGNAGRFRQKAARAATDPCTKSPRLNALDVPLPNAVNRENIGHNREGTDIRSQVRDVRFKRKSGLPPPLDRRPLMTQSGHFVVLSQATAARTRPSPAE